MEPYFVSVVSWGEDPYDHKCSVGTEINRYDFRDRPSSLRDYINIYTDRVKCEQYAWFSINVLDVCNGVCIPLVCVANPLRERKELNIAARELQKKSPPKKQVNLEDFISGLSQSSPLSTNPFFTSVTSAAFVLDEMEEESEEDEEEHDTHGGMPQSEGSF